MLSFIFSISKFGSKNMNHLIAIMLLIYFNAGWGWWLAFGAIIGLEIYALIKTSLAKTKEQSTLLRPDGKPYTEQDIEFIWQHGYKTAIQQLNSTRQ